MKQCGIYKVKNLINGDFYIGQSINMNTRKNYHFSKLRKGEHHNIHLQRAFNKYGAENFIFEIILYCEEFELTRYEQSIFDLNKAHCYNVRECVDSNKGNKVSDETKSKMSEKMSGEGNPFYGKIHSEETKEKMSEIHKNITDETREKMSKAKKGKPSSYKGKHHSEETKKLMSKNHPDFKGENHPNFGVHWSEDIRNKMSDAKIGVKKNENCSSKYVGVSFDKSREKWSSQIKIKGICIHIGRFETETEAAMAYNDIVSELFGWKAKLNIITQEEIEKLWMEE
jgi:hypothetical protein